MKLFDAFSPLALFLGLTFYTSYALGQNLPIFSSFDVPGAVSTVATGVNTAGNIVGYYSGSDAKNHGFLLSGGTYKFLNVPNATQTAVYGINDRNQAVGSYIDSAGISHAFVFKVGFTTMMPPGSVESW